MATVLDLAEGQRGTVREFSLYNLPIKLLELGCLPGNVLELVQIAPLRDPLYINLNGNHIAIRRSMAALIELDIIEESQTQ